MRKWNTKKLSQKSPGFVKKSWSSTFQRLTKGIPRIHSLLLQALINTFCPNFDATNFFHTSFIFLINNVLLDIHSIIHSIVQQNYSFKEFIHSRKHANYSFIPKKKSKSIHSFNKWLLPKSLRKKVVATGGHLLPPSSCRGFPWLQRLNRSLTI